ncbi:hypothetical protein KDJ21_019115 [Metabacillus litoralis]|uniref:hypothetical protein n=1 Tax=Metabacillus TaxID=2675233 RepID=UPI001BA396E8|nr:hypothetical protein [Metabacillus litoralis]UHA58917.1 hypothetical protein KDJ21_019115 [Metabacillus litoralis]
MVKSKLALISSAVILCICMSFYFPYPTNKTIDARASFMMLPIRDQDGYVVLGIIGSFLFILAMILLGIGLKKYRVRTMIIVILVYSILPTLLITMYQETLAKGIAAISYDGSGTCQFDHVSEDLLNGECSIVLHNRSSESVSFEIEFLDSFFPEDEVRMESLMNLNGPHIFTIEGNSEETIEVKALLDLTDVPNPIGGGTSTGIHIKLIEGEDIRIL